MKSKLPRISITIPNFNGASYLSEAIESVLDQQYPNLDLSVVDGGSSDGSVDIIRQFEKHLNWWVSEKDSGQSEAINKGFARSDGIIFNWLCSDDLLADNSLVLIGEKFERDSKLDLIAGKCRLVRTTGEEEDSFWTPTQTRVEMMPITNPFPQPSCYFKKNIIKRDYLVRPDLHFSMDFELWNYIFSSKPDLNFAITDSILSIYRITGKNKTSVGGFKTINELSEIYRSYSRERIPLSQVYRYTRMPLDQYLIQKKNIKSSIWISFIRLLWKINSSILNRIYGSEKVYSISKEWEYFYR